MRSLILTLALIASLPAAAQPSLSGTWTALTTRTLASEGDTVRVPAAQTLILRATGDDVSGSSFHLLTIPENAYGDGAPEWSVTSEATVQGHVEDDAARLTIWTFPTGRANTFEARLTDGGSRLVVRPVDGSRGVRAEYRRVPTAQ